MKYIKPMTAPASAAARNPDVAPTVEERKNLTNLAGIAQVLNVSKRYVQQLVRNKVIPSYSLGRRCRRFDPIEVRAALDKLFKVEPRKDAQ